MPGINFLKNKKVILRCDFDVPVNQQQIVGNKQQMIIKENFRIKKQKPTIDFLLKQSAAVIIAHIKSINSFKNIVGEIENILGHKINFIESLGDLDSKLKNLEIGKLYLLENMRSWPGEEKNDKIFAKILVKGFDVYINNAFAVCHRKHASVSAVTEFLPSYPGFLIEEEFNQLNRLIDLPKEGKLFIMGGAKTKTKIPVIKNFIDKSESILVGGVVANDILKARGVDIGFSVVDEDPSGLLEGLDIRDSRLVMPVDFNIHERRIFDIGPKTIKEYSSKIENSKVVIWNGPVGLFEDKRFSAGTNAIAEAISNSSAFKTLGGGDTIAAVNKLGLLDKFDFVSTGGGAMLEFLAGNKLPGLDSLGFYR